MALSPNGPLAAARFRITESGSLTTIDGTGSIPGTNLDLITRRAGPATLTITFDNVAGALPGGLLPFTTTLLSLNDWLSLARAISIPQPVPGQPFSSLSSAYWVAVSQLTNQPAGSVTPAAYTELPSPGVWGRGLNY